MADKVVWFEVTGKDGGKLQSFYGELFGWKATESMDMGPMGVYRMFGRGTQSMGGMMNKVDDMANLPTAWLIYFKVDGADAAAARVKANGGAVTNGPMEVPGGDWILQCTDPQGGAFALHAKKR